jgi:hypothetical protein
MVTTIWQHYLCQVEQTIDEHEKLGFTYLGSVSHEIDSIVEMTRCRIVFFGVVRVNSFGKIFTGTVLFMAQKFYSSVCKSCELRIKTKTNDFSVAISRSSSESCMGALPLENSEMPETLARSEGEMAPLGTGLLGLNFFCPLDALEGTLILFTLVAFGAACSGDCFGCFGVIGTGFLIICFGASCTFGSAGCLGR